MTDQPTPQTEAVPVWRRSADAEAAWHEGYAYGIKTAQARTEALDVEPALLTGVLRFYAEQMPAYAVAAGLNREEYAAVMLDVRKVRARLAAKADR